MKIVTFALLIILSLSYFSLLIRLRVFVNADSTPNTWIVDDDYGDTIQEAINNATDGDTILVHNGIYLENVIVNKSVSLIGEDIDLTIVDGSEINSTISIIASNVSLTRFTVKRSGSSPASASAINIGNSVYNVTIDGNKIIESNNGISLYSSNNNTIVNNVISSNSFHGIYLYSSSGNIVSGNIMVDDYYGGVYLYSCSNNVISDNTISFTTYGIYLYSSSDNTVSGNTVSLNNYGIYLTFSSSNTIYRNNFNNTKQALSDSANIWSFNGEGNYWSDYTGQDVNGDGIGDAPYTTDTSIRDDNPLMGKFSTFNIAYKGKTYILNVISNSTIAKLVLEIGVETGNKILLFNATGADGTVGFSRIWLPTELMKYPYIVLNDNEELNQTLFGNPNETEVCLYFAYVHNNYTIRIISSEALHLYYELFANFLLLNTTYYELLNVYALLLENYTLLQESFGALNEAYQQLLGLNVTYYELLNNYHDLNVTYYALLRAYDNLLGNYTLLLERMPDSEQVQNIRNLVYIIAAMSTLYIVTTVYLSKRAHTGTTAKSKMASEEKQ